ncbi:hypothetical protein SAMN05216198_1011 [Halopseudomonas litoralis]|uniref:Uncharacterized protein n=1 Tax=Halopseudomonas litoralis TaxID=797277 RepID=A0A1H1NU77_9GAMM|nr:hypothetical protein [Halopseudomonas litoralis]SDS02493.1 hypothetical protein SAMN05216198_1011 [Halopseudomonas litoralis]
MNPLYLSEHGTKLLPSQLALNGTFNHRVLRRGHATQIEDIVPLSLLIEQGQYTIHLILHIHGSRHSWSVAKADARKMSVSVQSWIEDCANGRLEGAA